MTFEEFKQRLQKEVEADQGLTDDQKKEMLSRVDQVKPFIDVISKQESKLQLNDAEKHALAYLIDQSKPTKGMSASDYAALQYTAMSFVHEHKQEITELTDGTDEQSGQEVRLSFIVWLMDYDGLSKYAEDQDAGVKLDLLPGLYDKADPTIDDILDVVGFGNAVLLYKTYKANKVFDPITHKTYRTREKAKEAGALTEAPKNMAVPTLKDLQYSLSLYNGAGRTYLQPFTSTDGLTFKGGHMYFKGFNGTAQEISDVELQNLITKEGIQEINLGKLRIFYSILLWKFQQNNYKYLDDVIHISVPALAEAIGLSANLNKGNIEGLINATKAYHNIVGVAKIQRNGRHDFSYYPVLNFEGYDAKTNTISFSSPYMNFVIRQAYNVSIRRTKDGTPKLKKNGEPLRLPTDSYMIDSSIAKEKNKAAVENVVIIVQLIEQAGDNIPRIKASTIVERNPQLKERLETVQNPRRVLKDTFSKTWELLRTKTHLRERYKNIKLPEPNDPATIPNKSTLNTMVFSFPHEGKIKD